MITRKLCILETNDSDFIREKQIAYSYAFRRLYKMIEESSDKDFVSRFKEVFSLNDIEYDSLISEVKSLKNREMAHNASILEKIDKLNEGLSNGTLTKKERYKSLKKISYLTKRIGKETCFGGLAAQRKLTYECNKPIRDERKINAIRNELRTKRVLPFRIVGEANQKGNRFFDLSKLGDGVVIYKPYRGKKILLNVLIPKNWHYELSNLSTAAECKGIPVSVSLCEHNICLTYDEERLNGYAVDEVSRRKEVSDIKRQHHPKEVEKELIKSKYKEYYDLQREKKLKGKIDGRCIAIDMNPTNVGYSVLDKTDNGVKVIASGLYDLTKICAKSDKGSSSNESKYLVNKRRYEITIIAKELFKVLTHYKCSKFVIEDLGSVRDSNLSREANRKVKNIWNRELFLSVIQRRCNENGVELIKVNPCYTSFIGNIQHKFVDATNASIEIGRRGLHKYENGGFYPHRTAEDNRTLEAKFGNVVDCSTDRSWVEIYKSLRKSIGSMDFSYRLRTRLCEVNVPYKVFSVNSYKSNVKVITFN